MEKKYVEMKDFAVKGNESPATAKKKNLVVGYGHNKSQYYLTKNAAMLYNTAAALNHQKIERFFDPITLKEVKI